jgi:hypothetical protein
MIPNMKMEGLIELKEFKRVVVKYRVSSLWCRNAVFLFTKSSAIVFQDLIQEDEVDAFLYDRIKGLCTANMYGIADRIVDPKDNRLNELTSAYLKVIDFGRLSLHSDRKKESLSFSLALLDLYGSQILFEPLSLNFRELFSAPIVQVTNQWEQCMHTHPN